MDRTPCFNTLAATRHLDRIDAANASLEDIQAELTRDMQRALAGLQAHVPGYAFGGSTAREVLQSAADEVQATLDYMECAQALMLALKDSTCPLVAKLRTAVVERYVKDTAERLADVRGVE